MADDEPDLEPQGDGRWRMGDHVVARAGDALKVTYMAEEGDPAAGRIVATFQQAVQHIRREQARIDAELEEIMRAGEEHERSTSAEVLIAERERLYGKVLERLRASGHVDQDGIAQLRDAVDAGNERVRRRRADLEARRAGDDGVAGD